MVDTIRSKALAALRTAVIPLAADLRCAPAAIRVLTELSDAPSQRISVTPELSRGTRALLSMLASRKDLAETRKKVVSAWAEVERVFS